jgi:hypothetical protein
MSFYITDSLIRNAKRIDGQLLVDAKIQQLSFIQRQKKQQQLNNIMCQVRKTVKCFLDKTPRAENCRLVTGE